MSDFDPNKYLTTRVHGGVREIVGEEAKKIRERVRNRMMDNLLEMSPERMIEALNNEVRLRDMEIERLHIENIQMRFALGYPMPAHLEHHIIPVNPFKCGTCDAKKRTSFVITDEIDE